MNQFFHYSAAVFVLFGTCSCKKKEVETPKITSPPVLQEKSVNHSAEYESLSKAIGRLKALPVDEQKQQFESNDLFTRFRALSADELSGLLENYDLGKEPKDLIATELTHNPEVAVEVMSKGLFERVAVAISKKDLAQAEDWVGGFSESPTKQAILAKIRAGSGVN